MRKTDCRKVRREIEETTPGYLLSSDANDHMMSCAACETLAREHVKLRAIVSSLGTVAAPDDFDFRLRARLAAEKHKRAQPFALVNLSLGLRASALATILLVIGSAFVVVKLRNGMDSQPSAGVAKTESNPASNQQGTSPGNIVAPAPQADEGNTVAVSMGSRSERTPKRAGSRRDVATLNDPNRVRSRDQASTPATVLKRFDEVAGTYPTSAFPINASYQSLKVSVDSGRGSSRTISLPRVSFGSQQALSQSASPLIASARETW
jgi:hypothetical protein